MVHHKKDTDKKKEAKKVSFQQDHLMLPNGQHLRGVQVQSGLGEYKVPSLTDHHTFATKRRIKE
jgi:hypothetical protein